MNFFICLMDFFIVLNPGSTQLCRIFNNIGMNIFIIYIIKDLPASILL
jgi:hypothetical protein